MRKLVLWLALVALVVTVGSACAGEAAEKPKDPPKKAAPAPEPEGDANEVVAKIDEITITRGELNQTRRLMSLTQRSGALPTNEQILEQLINRALWSRHFDKKNLRPKGPEIQQAIRNLDANLKRKNSSYQRFLLQRGLTVATADPGSYSGTAVISRSYSGIDSSNLSSRESAFASFIRVPG